MRISMSKIRFKPIIIKYKKAHINGAIENRSTVGICLYDEDTKCETKAQPISIVAKAWPSVKLQPLNTYMTRFVRFLNYCFFEYESPVKTIANIKPGIVLSYFTDISMTSGRNYVRASEDNVNKALYYLWMHGIATGFKESDFAVVETPRGTTVYLKDVKNCYTLPPSKARNRLHDMDTKTVLRMFDLAIRYTPRIALGLYFQIFGGLRYAEVVSLDYNKIHFNLGDNANAVYVDIADTDLRPDLRRGFLSRAKKNRKQQIIYIPELFDQLYELNIKLTAKGFSNAVFINANGNAMTEASYAGYFRKLKKHLIDSLKKDSDFRVRNYGISLESIEWGTHIGRGIYSNLVAEVAKTSAEIARARGDSSQDSSLPYLSDNSKTRTLIIENVQKLINERPTKLGEIND